MTTPYTTTFPQAHKEAAEADRRREDRDRRRDEVEGYGAELLRRAEAYACSTPWGKEAAEPELEKLAQAAEDLENAKGRLEGAEDRYSDALAALEEAIDRKEQE